MKLALFFLTVLLLQTFSISAATETLPLENDVLFCIGSPDAFCSEFALVKEGYAAFPQKFPSNIRYEIGKSTPENDWAFLHPTKQDEQWAKGGAVHPFTIVFPSDLDIAEQTSLVVGYMGVQGDLSDVNVSVNETVLPVQVPQNIGNSNIVFNPRMKGKAAAMIFNIPGGTLHKGQNEITITLTGKSWILYDYVALRKEAQPLTIREKPEKNLLADFQKNEMKNVKKIIFTTRTQTNEHWYANFGYYAHEEQVGKNPPAPNEGGKLCLYDIETKQVEVLIGQGDASLTHLNGLVRDPCVHYDGNKILFSFKPEGTKYFHLYELEINSDGQKTAVRQITDGPFDDIEPVYTPNNEIIFVSSRGKRWVNCWLTQVAILHGCNLDGSNIHALSGNIEHDNTPWFLPDGRVLYMRWEYVDRSQVHYHHLWTMNPDGTKQMVYFGNMHAGTVFIDAKPIPNSDKVVASFSWGHGRTEHAGAVGIIDPRNGPDDPNSARAVTADDNYRDPWAFSENAFMAAHSDKIELINGDGETQTLFQVPKEWQEHADVGKTIRDRSEVRSALSPVYVHEPRPLVKQERERIIGKQTNPASGTGELTLMDIYQGRNMQGVKRGEIKKLLILETLPMPIHYTGGMEPLTYGGSFTLERVIGTVPVDSDGSAKFELPAMRSFFFVALDENDWAVKRMQSFVSVMPGEQTSCVGCHEERTATPQRATKMPRAMGRKSSPITEIAYRGQRVPSLGGLPDVINYPIDIQPIWDAHCVSCHNSFKRDGGVSMTGHRTPMYSVSYYTLTARDMLADGRNLPKSNYPPRTLGSGASRLVQFCNGSHYDVKLSEREKTLVRLWIETGATYIGTYAGLGSGMVGGYSVNTLDRRDTQWAEVQAMSRVLQENCVSCHTGNKQLPLTATDEIGGPPWVFWNGKDDVRRRFSRQLLYDLTVPEESLLLLAPLAKGAGGTGMGNTSAVFSSKDDPRYQTILAGIEREKQWLDEVKRFDMPGFQPRPEYLREMKRFGILPKDFDVQTPVNFYDLDRQYWQSLWHRKAD